MPMQILNARLIGGRMDSSDFEVVRVVCREQLGRPYEVEVEIVGAVGRSLDEEAVLGEPASVVLEHGGLAVRRIHGVVERIDSSSAAESGQLSWTLVIGPRVSTLALTTSTEVEMDLSVPEIVADRLERAGLKPGDDFDFKVLAPYPAREFVVQFKESDLAFVSRLCEHVGVTLYFRQEEEREVAVFTDDASGFSTEQAGLRIPFRARGERQDVFDLRTTRTAQPARVVVKDYNYRTPSVALHADAATRGKVGSLFEYGNHFKTPEEADRVAKIRAEELAWQAHVFNGRSARPELSAGTRFHLEGHPLGDRELLVVEIEHVLTRAAGLFAGDTRDGSYENRFKAIDASVPFRPLRSTPKPHVSGVLTGIVEAAQPGQYADLDGDGRYHVRFAFDTGPTARGKASRPIRMAQPHAGPGYGFHFPLRDGVEVVLSCVEGDPDRPIISGAVPNPTTPSTVGASNGMRNVIRTGGGTEINVDDYEGNERLKISVPFGNTVLQLGAPNAPSEGVYVGTDKKVRVNSSEGMSFADQKEIKGEAPEVWWHGTSTAGMHGAAKAEVSSSALVQVGAPRIEEIAGSVHAESAPVITSNASGAWSAHAGGVAVVSAGASANIAAPTVAVQGTLITVEGNTITIKATGTVNVSAPTVNVSGDGVVDIRGGEIKLNV